MDLLNQKYGRLLVIESLGIEITKNGRRRTFWRCRCDCGSIIKVRHDTLRSGQSRSCGCLQRELLIQRSLRPPNENTVIKNLISQYRSNCKFVHREFNLTEEQCKFLFTSICNYCGKLPSQLKKYRSSTFLYNGIDRIDSSKGYTIENCVSCCKYCNGMKTNHSIEDFRNMIEAIYKHFVLPNKSSLN